MSRAAALWSTRGMRSSLIPLRRANPPGHTFHAVWPVPDTKRPTEELYRDAGIRCVAAGHRTARMRLRKIST